MNVPHRAGITCLLLALSWASPSIASVSWFKGTVAEAITAGQRDLRPTLLYFTADWCPACQTLEKELLGTDDGRTATARHRAVKIDVDAAGGEALVARYVVLSYPSALVLDKGGTELGRVVGFDGKEAWTRSLSAVTASAESLQALEGAVKRTPEAPQAQLALGRALLERGHTDRGVTSLQWVALRWPESDAAPEALWTLGRYYHRVRREPSVAQHLWRELGERYPETSWVYSAWSWYGKAQASLGRLEHGARSLEWVARRAPSRLTLTRIYAGYLKRHALRAHYATGLELVTQALEVARRMGDEKAKAALEGLEKALR
ncbi:MAG: thioredoxin family protein [Myxococcota bacterium]